MLVVVGWRVQQNLLHIVSRPFRKNGLASFLFAALPRHTLYEIKISIPFTEILEAKMENV